MAIEGPDGAAKIGLPKINRQNFKPAKPETISSGSGKDNFYDTLANVFERNIEKLTLDPNLGVFRPHNINPPV